MGRQTYGVAGVFVASVFFFFAGPTFAVQQYSVQLINNFAPFSINSSGEVVGEPQDSAAYAAVWNSGTTTELTPPGLTEPYAGQVNNAGQIVGNGMNNIGWWQGYEWDPASGYVNVTVPDGYIANFSSINDLGQIGGAIGSLTINSTIACIWTTPQSYVLLPSLGNDGANVVSLNDVGQAIGNSGDYPSYANYAGNTAKYGLDHAVLWENGQVIDLTPDDPWSFVAALNNRGQVVGNLIYPDMSSGSVFEWDPINGLTILPGGNSANPTAINDAGQIVGYMTDSTLNDIGLATLWDNGMLYDLNDFIPDDSGWVLQQAYSINNLGQIVGIGTYDGNEYQTFLLTPIPEPVGILIAVVMGFWCCSFRASKRG